MPVLILLLFISVLKSFAQGIGETEKSTIKVVAKSFGDSIVLRYAPSDPGVWDLANKNGYNIVKYIIARNGKKLKEPKRVFLTSGPIKPLPLSEWEPITKRNDNAAIAAQALYGKKFEVAGAAGSVNAMMSLATATQETEMRFSFALFAADQSPEIAMASGLWFVDRNVTGGEKYVYRVYTERDQSYLDNTGTVFIGTDDTVNLPSLKELSGRFSDRTVMLSWNNLYYKDIYCNFVVERSDDGGVTFKPTHHLPFVNTSPTPDKNTEYIFKMDSLPENGKIYIYRIKGKTLFGEIGPPSDTVKGMGSSANAKGAPAIIKTENLISGAIQIEWKVSELAKGFIKNFELLRAERSEGKLNKIGQVNSHARSYIDSFPRKINYYVVKSNLLDGSSSFSFPFMVQLMDSIAPKPPENLKGNIDSTGIARITWHKAKEEDLACYKVYMANSEEEEFTQVTSAPIEDTIFTDTINIRTLTSKVYFKVAALDFNYNLSLFSEILTLERPDLIPPAAPVIDHYWATDRSINLHWIPSNSADVESFKIYRKETGEEAWINILTILKDSRLTSYSDTAVEKRKEYNYIIVAMDKNHLESSRENFISASLIDQGFRDTIVHFKGKADRIKKEIALSWTYGSNIPEKILIYRGKKEGEIRIYKAVEGKENNFVDKDLEINNEYIYRIKATYGDGGESIMSEKVLLKF